MLTNQQIQNINSAEKVIFTTCDLFNQPRSIWVVPSRVEQNRIILSNIQMDKSFANITKNPKCFINVLLSEQDDLQYKITGLATVFDDGELFNEIKTFEETQNLPPELKVNAIIVVDIQSVEQSNG